MNRIYQKSNEEFHSDFIQWSRFGVDLERHQASGTYALQNTLRNFYTTEAITSGTVSLTTLESAKTFAVRTKDTVCEILITKK